MALLAVPKHDVRPSSAPTSKSKTDLRLVEEVRNTLELNKQTQMRQIVSRTPTASRRPLSAPHGRPKLASVNLSKAQGTIELHAFSLWSPGRGKHQVLVNARSRLDSCRDSLASTRAPSACSGLSSRLPSPHSESVMSNLSDDLHDGWASGVLSDLRSAPRELHRETVAGGNSDHAFGSGLKAVMSQRRGSKTAPQRPRAGSQPYLLEDEIQKTLARRNARSKPHQSDKAWSESVLKSLGRQGRRPATTSLPASKVPSTASMPRGNCLSSLLGELACKLFQRHVGPVHHLGVAELGNLLREHGIEMDLNMPDTSIDLGSFREFIAASERCRGYSMDMRAVLRGVFESYDINRSGLLEPTEYSRLLEDYGRTPRNLQESKDLGALIASCRESGIVGALCFDEFLVLACKLDLEQDLFG